jgi:hypothetical protein
LDGRVTEDVSAVWKEIMEKLISWCDKINGSRLWPSICSDRSSWQSELVRQRFKLERLVTASARPGPARHRPLRQVSEQFQNTGQSKTFPRSEACRRPIPASKRRVLCVLCCNWFLMPIGSEAVRGRSPDPSRAEPCWADPIQYASSFTLTGWYLAKTSQALRQFLIHWASSSEF